MIVRGIIWIAVLAAGLYAVSCLGLYLFQRRLLYFPDPAHYTPEQAGLTGTQEISLATPDGERVAAWYKPGRPGAPVLLYFHGNGGGLYLRRERIEAFAGAGYGVFIPGYRGYSGSTGSPSEKALIADGLLAYDYLNAHGVAPSQIVLYGESLGTGVAAQVASLRQVSAVVLEAPYSSIAAEAKAHYGIFPIDWLLSRPLRFRRPYRPDQRPASHNARFARRSDLRKFSTCTFRCRERTEGIRRIPGRRA